MGQPFTRLPSLPELPALEQEILAFWQRERVFDRLREQNAEGPRFSFFDGPVTANKTMGVHTAWGRTLKDVFLRYRPCAATTSATRTAGTARGCGSRSASKSRWA